MPWLTSLYFAFLQFSPYHIVDLRPFRFFDFLCCTCNLARAFTYVFMSSYGPILNDTVSDLIAAGLIALSMSSDMLGALPRNPHVCN